MARSKSSAKWLREHFEDPYVKLAQKAGYRSRAAFKLLEIQERDKLCQPGMLVVDLGAAPGGWSQLVTKWVGAKGIVIALDKLDMPALQDVTFLQGDFQTDHTLEQLEHILAGRRVDIVLSDMAPEMSGHRSVDQPSAMYLVELALEFAKQHLKPGGSFLVKVFQGEGSENFLKILRSDFKQIFIRKPKASRARSNEIYVLAKGFLSI